MVVLLGGYNHRSYAFQFRKHHRIVSILPTILVVLLGVVVSTAIAASWLLLVVVAKAFSQLLQLGADVFRAFVALAISSWY